MLKNIKLYRRQSLSNCFSFAFHLLQYLIFFILCTKRCCCRRFQANSINVACKCARIFLLIFHHTSSSSTKIRGAFGEHDDCNGWMHDFLFSKMILFSIFWLTSCQQSFYYEVREKLSMAWNLIGSLIRSVNW